jgi:hypothetical protein
MTWPSLGLSLIVLAVGTAGAAEEKKQVPVYTNDDLDRIAPFRDQTGVSSSGAPVTTSRLPADKAGKAGPSGDFAAKSEAYWRREADKLRARQQKARDRIENLRSRLAAVEARSGPRSGEARARSAAQAEIWRGQISVLEARMREEDGQLTDRARRAGALPGWLR